MEWTTEGPVDPEQQDESQRPDDQAADHQHRALEYYGLADEFGDWGCDAIDHVCEALLAVRKQRDAARLLLDADWLAAALMAYECEGCLFDEAEPPYRRTIRAAYRERVN